MKQPNAKRTHDPLSDLDRAFESLEVEPLSDSDLGRVSGGTLDIGCTEGATCNSKCGDTEYWECHTDICGETTISDWTCSGSGCLSPTAILTVC